MSLWYKQEPAASILADCAANPPAQRTRMVERLTRHPETQYVGDRVKRLNAIHRAEAERLLAQGDASGNYDQFEAHCAYSVQMAISDALFFAAIERAKPSNSAGLIAGESERRLSGEDPFTARADYAAGSRSSDGSDTAPLSNILNRKAA